jgi:N-acetylglucosamine-6-sulfatase
MGEHRLQPGKYTPYETDIHVPMIVRGPGVPAGQTREQITANVDLAETFAELAGIPPLPFSDGRSLKGLLGANLPSAWRQAFLLEEFNTGEFLLPSESESQDPASLIGIREPPDAGDLAAANSPMPSYYGFQAHGYKYVEYETGEKELYLASDPYELHNSAIGMDKGIMASLATYLRTLQKCKGDSCRTADSVQPPPVPGANLVTSPGTPAKLSTAGPATPPGIGNSAGTRRAP